MWSWGEVSDVYLRCHFDWKSAFALYFVCHFHCSTDFMLNNLRGAKCIEYSHLVCLLSISSRNDWPFPLFFCFWKANQSSGLCDDVLSYFSCFSLALCSPLPLSVKVALYELLSTRTTPRCFIYSQLNDLSSTEVWTHISNCPFDTSACLNHKCLRLKMLETELITSLQSLTTVHLLNRDPGIILDCSITPPPPLIHL